MCVKRIWARHRNAFAKSHLCSIKSLALISRAKYISWMYKHVCPPAINCPFFSPRTFVPITICHFPHISILLTTRQYWFLFVSHIFHLFHYLQYSPPLSFIRPNPLFPKTLPILIACMIRRRRSISVRVPYQIRATERGCVSDNIMCYINLKC